jgi:putative acetyltransferase
MSAGLVLRPSTPQDVPRLLAIWRAAVDATHDFLAPEDRQRIDAIVADDYLPSAGFTIACEDGEVLGFLGRTGAKIDSLFVDPAAHRRGVGRALIGSVAAEEPGDLLVDVNEQNEGAAAFYEREGFAVEGRSPADDMGLPYPLLHMRRPAGR